MPAETTNVSQFIARTARASFPSRHLSQRFTEESAASALTPFSDQLEAFANERDTALKGIPPFAPKMWAPILSSRIFVIRTDMAASSRYPVCWPQDRGVDFRRASC